MKCCNGWLNVFKPTGISSAKAVYIVKKALNTYLNNSTTSDIDKQKDQPTFDISTNNPETIKNKATSLYKLKIGHAGTLDLEASGILPIGIGEATKLMRVLVDAKKTYIFTIKFGAQTDTDDFSGKVTATTEYIPSESNCKKIISKFLGQIKQTPNIFSAIKVNGIRSYDLARQGVDVILASRIITIYSLDLLNYNDENATATFITTCSKGTYIRSLARDIALCLQSLGFVLELRRTRVGIFTEASSINVLELEKKHSSELKQFFEKNKLHVEAILDDILVLEATEQQAKQIKFGQLCAFGLENIDQSKKFKEPLEKVESCITKSIELDKNLVAITYNKSLIAIGELTDNYFNSFRVFNLI